MTFAYVYFVSLWRLFYTCEYRNVTIAAKKLPNLTCSAVRLLPCATSTVTFDIYLYFISFTHVDEVSLWNCTSFSLITFWFLTPMWYWGISSNKYHNDRNGTSSRHFYFLHFPSAVHGCPNTLIYIPPLYGWNIADTA